MCVWEREGQRQTQLQTLKVKNYWKILWIVDENAEGFWENMKKLQILYKTEKSTKIRHISEGTALFGIMKSGGMVGYTDKSFSTWKNRKQIQAWKRRHAKVPFLQEAGGRSGGLEKK